MNDLTPLKRPWGGAWVPPDPNLKSTSWQKVLLNPCPVRDATVYGWENPSASASLLTLQSPSLAGIVRLLCVCVASEQPCCDWFRLCCVKQRWGDVSVFIPHFTLGCSWLNWELFRVCSWGKCIHEMAWGVDEGKVHCWWCSFIWLYVWIHITCECRHVLVGAHCHHWMQLWTLHAKHELVENRRRTLPV